MALNEQIRLLVELQKLDTRIIARSSFIKAIPSQLSSMEKPLEDARAILDKHRRKYESAEKKKRDMEGELDETNERIDKLRTRTSGIKDNKAYQAHLKEIEAAEKARYGLEDKILALMETVEADGKELEAAEGKLKTEEQKTAELKKQLNAEVREAEKQLDVQKTGRKKLSAPMDREIYDLYMNLLKNLKGLAVVEVKNTVCQGCNMNVMLQLFVEIQRNEEIIHCPQCRRILYYNESPE